MKSSLHNMFAYRTVPKQIIWSVIGCQFEQKYGNSAGRIVSRINMLDVEPQKKNVGNIIFKRFR